MEATPLTYQQTLDYLFAQLPMFSRIGSAAIKKDLTNTLKLCEALGQPQQQFKSVHIAGTNGKGSTSHMLAAVFQRAGYKTGLYTSPHLVDFRERIRINGKEIPEQFVIDFVAKHKALIEEVMPSFFEITVAMAFMTFAAEEVDIAIIETGLGGRLDSTNVITPVLSIITNISYDHTDLLGDTLTQIAKEKAGIIKPGIPVIIGESDDETERVFFETSVHTGSTVYYADTLWDIVKTKTEDGLQHYKTVHKGSLKIIDLWTDMLGSYQQHNIKTVLTATELLGALGWKLLLEDAFDALANVKGLSGLRGRWEVLQTSPLVVADVAHNAAGLAEMLQQWTQVPANQKIVILGFVKDKDVRTALAQFPADNIYYCTNASIPRALPAEDLHAMAVEAGLNAAIFSSVEAAVHTAIANSRTEDAVLITGSFFIVGEALQALADPKKDIA
jgi:dihydrofolate synthase/folylpolyglutamate synthase